MRTYFFAASIAVIASAIDLGFDTNAIDLGDNNFSQLDTEEIVKGTGCHALNEQCKGRAVGEKFEGLVCEWNTLKARCLAVEPKVDQEAEDLMKMQAR